MYAENENKVKEVSEVLRSFGKSFAPSRKTERGELMRKFKDRLNLSRQEQGFHMLSMSRMGRIFQGIPTKDLYALESKCEKAKNFSACFWFEINPKKHLTPKQ